MDEVEADHIYFFSFLFFSFFFFGMNAGSVMCWMVLFDVLRQHLEFYMRGW